MGSEVTGCTFQEASDALDRFGAIALRIKEQRDELLAALIALRDAVKANPSMQGREFIDLGIQVNNAISRATGATP